MACAPYDYVCRAQAGELFGPTGTSENQPASPWWWIVIGVAMLAIIIDVQPKLGGWLLLLIVIGLALSPRARGIITGKV
jgi:hypothetical protein